jgi:hypothetical protein
MLRFSVWRVVNFFLQENDCTQSYWDQLAVDAFSCCHALLVDNIVWLVQINKPYYRFK